MRLEFHKRNFLEWYHLTLDFRKFNLDFTVKIWVWQHTNLRRKESPLVLFLILDTTSSPLNAKRHKVYRRPTNNTKDSSWYISLQWLIQIIRNKKPGNLSHGAVPFPPNIPYSRGRVLLVIVKQGWFGWLFVFWGRSERGITIIDWTPNHMKNTCI